MTLSFFSLINYRKMKYVAHMQIGFIVPTLDMPLNVVRRFQHYPIKYDSLHRIKTDKIVSQMTIWLRTIEALWTACMVMFNIFANFQRKRMKRNNKKGKNMTQIQRT